MSERRDDTTQPDAPPTRERAPQNYYYDDGTGYEIYDPAADEDDTDDDAPRETADDEPRRERGCP